jgi:hypothetical protein
MKTMKKIIPFVLLTLIVFGIGGCADDKKAPQVISGGCCCCGGGGGGHHEGGGASTHANFGQPTAIVMPPSAVGQPIIIQTSPNPQTGQVNKVYVEFNSNYPAGGGGSAYLEIKNTTDPTRPNINAYPGYLVTIPPALGVTIYECRLKNIAPTKMFNQPPAPGPFYAGTFFDAPASGISASVVIADEGVFPY